MLANTGCDDVVAGARHAAPPQEEEFAAQCFKIVQVVAKKPLEPLPEYVTMVEKEMGGGLSEARPVSSVIKSISPDGGN